MGSDNPITAHVYLQVPIPRRPSPTQPQLLSRKQSLPATSPAGVVLSATSGVALVLAIKNTSMSGLFESALDWIVSWAVGPVIFVASTFWRRVLFIHV